MRREGHDTQVTIHFTYPGAEAIYVSRIYDSALNGHYIREEGKKKKKGKF
jgi:hypothetical protein